MSAALHHGDCLEVLRAMPADSVDSIVTDPPYGLSFMGRKWDYDVPSVEIWAECLRVLKPGGHLLAFAGTRTQHRMACRIEDGGFEIRDMIAWVYGSGFPKHHNALKPALEPITLARKPLRGSVAENVAAHGTGGLNIDGCRVGSDLISQHGRNASDNRSMENPNRAEPAGREWVGRWPANLLHDGSPEVVSLFPQTGASKASMRGTRDGAIYGGGAGLGGESTLRGHDDAGGSAARFFYAAKASRKDRDEGLDGFEAKRTGSLHATTKGQLKDLRLGDNYERPIPNRANTHPTVKPADLMRYLCRLVTPPGGVVLDPFMGSGSTGKAAVLEGFRFLGIEREAEYVEIALARIAASELSPLDKPR